MWNPFLRYLRTLPRSTGSPGRRSDFKPFLEHLEERTQPSNAPAPLGHLGVVPGQSIQAAVDAAAPGTEIDVAPGVYREAILVNKPGIRLVGRRGPHGSEPVLENPGGADDGILAKSADGFALRQFTVAGFGENGVVLAGVNGFVLSHVTAVTDGAYGLFPVHSANGLIEGCTASGHRDTGIYVGQSARILVRRNTAFANVNGIEIENCTGVRLTDNKSFGNAAGILVTLLPGLDVKTSSNIVLADNRVHGNNHANFADPDEIEAGVPPGTGILIVGADKVAVQGNTVTGNHFAGVAVVSTRQLVTLAGLPPDVLAGIEPDPDGVRVKGNRVTGNGGFSPNPNLPSGDLLWDGSGVGDHWTANVFRTHFPRRLP